MKRSIRLQLTLWYIGSITVFIIVFGIVVYLSFRAVLVRNLDQRLYNGGKILEEALMEFILKDVDDPASLYEPTPEGNEFLSEKIDEDVNEIFFVTLAYVQIRTFSENTAAQQSMASSIPVVKTASLEEFSLPLSQATYEALEEHPYVTENVSGIFPFPLRMVSLLAENGEGRPYIVQVALSFQEVKATLRNLVSIVAGLFPAVLILLALLAYVFMKRAFAPVREMVAVTKRITAEDLSLRLDPIDSHDEIGELADTLNSMIARLEQSFQQIRQFSGDVSHELKTPLAELKCNAEVALRKIRTQEEYQRAFQDIVEDVEYLQKIVEDLLLLARMDSHSQTFAFNHVALHEIFLEIFERAHPLANQKGLALEFQDMEHITINGDSGLLKQVFINLISNAIRYTPPGGKIMFSLREQEGIAVVTITDTGIGIPAEALPSIFDRFYRVEQSRSQETGGSGLGLAIAQHIVKAHGGNIEVCSVVDRGTTVQVFLPSIVSD